MKRLTALFLAGTILFSLFCTTVFAGETATEVIQPIDNTCSKTLQETGEAFTVGINEANFPDVYFREFVRDSFDEDSNGILTADELEKSTQLIAAHAESRL